MATTAKYHPQSVNRNNDLTCPWRWIRSGLNIEGFCDNYECLAYTQMVVINLGIGEYDFARLILERKNRCPLCEQSIRPTKFALTNCRWWYVNHYSTKEYPLNIVHNTYELHDLPCEYIIIEIMPLLKTDRVNSISPESICPICLSNAGDETDVLKLECSHIFHRDCLGRWLHSKELMANKCPVCRGVISERR